MRGRGWVEYDAFRLTQQRGERQKTRVEKGKWKRTESKGGSSDQAKWQKL